MIVAEGRIEGHPARRRQRDGEEGDEQTFSGDRRSLSVETKKVEEGELMVIVPKPR